MRPDQIKDEVGRLTLSEKLMLVEDIWDAIAISNAEIPMPLWQQKELDKRYEAYKTNALGLHDWDDVYNSLSPKS